MPSGIISLKIFNENTHIQIYISRFAAVIDYNLLAGGNKSSLFSLLLLFGKTW